MARRPATPRSAGFMDDFRRFLLRGLAALLPALLTIAILVWAYRFVDANMGVYITRAMMALCLTASDSPPGKLLSSEDAIVYGEPVDLWDEMGRRLTVESMVLARYDAALAASRDPSSSEVERGAAAERVRQMEPRRKRMMWRVFFSKYRLHLLGFVIAVIFVYFLGYFLASFIGRSAWRSAESLITRVPLIKQVYVNIKQVTDFLFSERRVEFSGVVAAQYPRRGLWSIGLATGPPLRAVQRVSESDLVTVFIPSSPTPVTGYVITIPREDVIELEMTIDEALRFTISGGVLKPGTLLPEDDSDPAE